MDVLIGAVFTLLVAGLTPVAAGLTADRVQRGKSRAAKKRALERVTADPRVFVGAKADGIYLDANGGMVRLLSRCECVHLDTGFIEFRNLVGQKMNWTLTEFEALHPLWTATHNLDDKTPEPLNELGPSVAHSTMVQPS